ncbi:unnamed protein product [Leptosia nina]|uniref:Uncharacterized protein n=1 Tax=Leptosia nina TaxID=320188 RepID=A0AAV1J4K4_9NEOP
MRKNAESVNRDVGWGHDEGSRFDWSGRGGAVTSRTHNRSCSDGRRISRTSAKVIHNTKVIVSKACVRDGRSESRVAEQLSREHLGTAHHYAYCWLVVVAFEI